MKKTLPKILLAGLSLIFVQAHGQQRYIDDIFLKSDIMVSSDVTYGINFNEYAPPSIGGPQLLPLQCDVYQPDPSVDTVSKRPVVIYFHTGSFLPKGMVSPMGNKKDSAAVEICTRFAKKGYVAISADYRLGWLANSTNLDLRRGTNLLAVYKSIQDAKAAVRYIRKTVDQAGNPYKVDDNQIYLIGQGSGGYTVLAYATVDDYLEVTTHDKFQYDANSSSGLYGDPVSAGDPYIDTSIVGDWNGYGGEVTLTGNNTPLGLPEVDMTAKGRNYINHPGYSDDVRMVLNLGGALGDSTWLEAGDVNMVSVHARYDFYAPYYEGMVQVPVGGQFFPVVEVAGSHTAIRIANSLGNNSENIQANYQDALSVKARSNQYNLGNQENLLTFNIMPPNPTQPYRINSNPWDFWDPSDPLGANETNPNNKAQSKAYIDTVMNYFTPRMKTEMEAAMGIDEKGNSFTISIYPNPASDVLYIKLSENVGEVSVSVLSLSGQAVMNETHASGDISLATDKLSKGIYLLKLNTELGSHLQRIIIE